MIPVQVGEGSARTEASDLQTRLLAPGVLRPFLLVTGLFFLWGIPNNLNDVLIRQFMKGFAISRFQAGLVQSAFYLGYFLFALPAGLLMKRRGYKTGLITGLVLFATGCFLFLPAARSSQYTFFLVALFIVASGLAFLETASNPFIAQLGPASTSERRLNLAQAFNPVGAISGVLAGTVFIFSGIELLPTQIVAMQSAGTYTAYLHGELMRTVLPYLVLGLLALVWAVLIGATRLPAYVRAREHTAEISGDWRQLLHERGFLLAVLTEFLYVGSQVGTWSYFIQYAQEYGRVTERRAGLLLTGSLVAFGVGRFVSAALMRHVRPGTLMSLYAAFNVGLLLIGILHPSPLGVAAVLFTSFFMSLMFPTIFAMGLKGLGANTQIGSSFLVMSIVGGAVLTPLMGSIAERYQSTAFAYIVPLTGYCVVALYARYMTHRAQSNAVTSTFDP